MNSFNARTHQSVEASAAGYRLIDGDDAFSRAVC
jgi:hypothetical protein